MLQRVLRGRIVFTPKGEGYTFEAPTRFDKLFNGIVVERPKFIKTGNEARNILGRKIRSTATMAGCSKAFAVNG